MASRRLMFFALVLWAVSRIAGAQAIDCAGASLNNSAQAVCTSTSLQSLAATMDKRYPRVADNLGVKQSQLEWTRVRDRCNGNLTCLTITYRERNAYLAKLPVSAKPVVSADSSRAPIKHLFLRHAPAQLLIPAPAQSVSASSALTASDQLNRAAGPTLVEVPATHWNPVWLLSGVFFASILLWQMLTNVCGKCPNCHHWFAKVEIDQRSLAHDPSELSLRRRRGLRQRSTTGLLASPEITRGRSAAVRHYNQCRMCLHEWETTSQETK